MNKERYGRTWSNGWKGNVTHAYGKVAPLGGDGAANGDVWVRVRSDGRHWWVIARPSATGRSGWDGVVGGRPLGRRVWSEGGGQNFLENFFWKNFLRGCLGNRRPQKVAKKEGV